MPSTVAGLSSNADNLRSAGWMTLGMAGYVTNDALIKLAAESLPLYQSIFFRGVWVCLLLGLLNQRRGTLGQLTLHFSKPIALRLACETLGTIFYLTALTRLPLAELTAVMQIVPIVVVFAAARLLREPVSAQRVLAVGIGFLGVLLVVKPGSASFSGWYLLGFLTVVVIVIRELATRQIKDSAPTQVVALLTATSITVMGLTFSLVQGWDTPRAWPLVTLIGAGTFLAVGYISSVETVRIGDLSFSAPFRYSVIVFSIILQIVVFGEVPDGLTFVGSAIVAAAGLWAFWGDQRRLAPFAVELDATVAELD